MTDGRRSILIIKLSSIGDVIHALPVESSAIDGSQSLPFASVTTYVSDHVPLRLTRRSMS